MKFHKWDIIYSLFVKFNIAYLLRVKVVMSRTLYYFVAIRIFIKEVFHLLQKYFALLMLMFKRRICTVPFKEQ